MKTFMHKPFIILVTVCLSVFGISCSDDDDDTPPAVKTELIAAIEEAELVLEETTEGTLDGQFPVGSKATVETAITAAEAIVANTSVTQTQVDNAVTSLETVVEEYLDKEITPIAEADLIAHWTFNEGTGTTANDNSANAFDGTLKAGPAGWGAGFPVWTTDRYGDASSALAFDDGANVEIPYNTKLNPAQMTIALWINAAEINADNRFLGLHSWIGYKFQLQSTNRPFMTVHSKDDAYFDRDAETELGLNTWYHIAVTFGGGKMIFYINGVAAKTWENTPGEAMSIASAPYNLVIGQDFPTDKYAATDANYETDKIIPLAWGGYFRGKLDELRMYKTVLTASQIQSIYDREKP
jgi:hypothetical protein